MNLSQPHKLTPTSGGWSSGAPCASLACFSPAGHGRTLPRAQPDLLCGVSHHTCKEEEHQVDAAEAAGLARKVARLEPLIRVKGRAGRLVNFAAPPHAFVPPPCPSSRTS